MRERVRIALTTGVIAANVLIAACSSGSTPAAGPVTAVPLPPPQDTIATMNDPRVGLAPGTKNTAGVAAKNLRLVSWSDKPPLFDSARGPSLTFINSDLAFRGNLRLPGQLQRLQHLGHKQRRRAQAVEHNGLSNRPG
jgi:hypothetical protein